MLVELAPQRVELVLALSRQQRDLVAHRPHFSAFRRDAAFPALVLGPVDFWAFLRFASICFSDVMVNPLRVSWLVEPDVDGAAVRAK